MRFGLPETAECGTLTGVSVDLLNERKGDFGRPRRAGKAELVAPVCIDALGETWAGYIAEGSERDRAVLVTVCAQPLRSRPTQRLLKIARGSKDIRHPHVLALIEVLGEGDELILVSEYMDGEPLSSILSAVAAESSQIPEAIALCIVKEAVETLAALKSAHPTIFLHGGLGPETIFVASFGETMLRHAGISAVAMQEGVFRSRAVALPYRAPEQLRNPRRIDESADVFSAGVLLWEMLAGRPLFGHMHHRRLSTQKDLREEEVREFEQRCQTMDIPKLSETGRPGGTLHPEVIALVHSALSRDPKERPASLLELAKAIGNLPPKVLVDSVGIASFVERVAGKTIAARLKRLNEGAPFPLRGSLVPSDRVTARPDSSNPTVEIPRGQGELQMSDLLGEVPTTSHSLKSKRSPSTRATAPLRPKVDDFDPITTTPNHKRQQSKDKLQAMSPPRATSPGSPPRAVPPPKKSSQAIKQGAAAASPPHPAAPPEHKSSPSQQISKPTEPNDSAEDSLLLELDEVEVLDAPNFSEQTPSPRQPPAVEVSSQVGTANREKSSGSWVFAALVLLAAGGVGGALVLNSEESKVKAGSADTNNTPADAIAEKEAPLRPESTPAAEDLPSSTKGKDTDDVTEGESVTGNEVKALDAEPAPVIPPPRRPASRPSKPTRPATESKSESKSNAFRPQGI